MLVKTKEKVRELHQKLQQEGYRPWLDEEDLLAWSVLERRNSEGN